jgi:hypothetical protein
MVKKLLPFLFGLVVAVSSNVLGMEIPSIKVGDKVEYVRSSRSSMAIRGATGSLQVMEKINDTRYGSPGYIVDVIYNLQVIIRGEQSGVVRMFVPESLFDQLHGHGVNNSYGSFNLDFKNFADAKDSHNTAYPNCSTFEATKIDHKYVPAEGSKNQVHIISHQHKGSIAAVTDLKISFKSHPDILVAGAVEIDISGVSDFGNQFTASLDAKLH